MGKFVIYNFKKNDKINLNWYQKANKNRLWLRNIITGTYYTKF